MLTVLLATHNGADTIGRTMAALAEAAAPPGGWKLVVIDNGSTDNTAAIILSWRERLPIHYVTEPELGKSVALNSGLAEVEGDLIVFTDDDVLPNRNWLVEWRRAADEQPDFAIFGGAVIPHFEAPPPKWLRREWYSMLYTATDDNRAAGEMDPRYVFGPNMAVRRSALGADVRFDAGFGPMAKTGGLGDETVFCLDLAERGHKAWFAPSASVGHIVQPHQFAVRWVLKRWYRFGRSEFAIERRRAGASGARAPLVLGAPRWLIRRFITDIVAVPVAAVRFDRARIFSRLADACFIWGQIREARLSIAPPPAGAP